MPNFLGRTDFNVGQDISVTITANTGETFSAEELGHLVDIDVDRQSSVVTVKACTRGGKPAKMGIPQGIKGKLVFARINNKLSKFLIDADQRWFKDKVQTLLTFQFQIANRDQSVDHYTARDCVLDGGKLFGGKADKEVDQDLVFEGPEITAT